VFRPLDQSALNGIAFYVTAQSQEVQIARDGNGAKSALIHMTGPPSTTHAVDDTGMLRQQPAHALRQLPVGGRPQHQMEVIRHQAVAQTPHTGSLLGLAEKNEKPVIVRDRIEQLATLYSSVDHVEDESG